MNKVENVKSDMQVLLRALKNRRRQANPSSDADGIYFSMEDLRHVLLDRENEQREQENRIKIQNKQKLIEKVLIENKNTVISAAGIADILGFNPISKVSPPRVEEGAADSKYEKYYSKLLQLREILDNKVGTVPPEIEFAWSLLRQEADKKKEVQDAIDRIVNGTYGICEITGEEIAAERLEAVPFTRYSVRGQREFERKMALRREKQTNALFADETEDVFGVAYDEQSEE
ncbi:MAG: TraR/DksA C4-type zinc finger protein [Puniceicoccales bacterium]|jgi:RNA polymerase-binding transcription factor DksA|nr:TraR/DksA C4-type zinc finger protein [Puniceicoccales bacterium]